MGYPVKPITPAAITAGLAVPGTPSVSGIRRSEESMMPSLEVIRASVCSALGGLAVRGERFFYVQSDWLQLTCRVENKLFEHV